MAKTAPKLQWKYMTEGNPFGHRVMNNIAEVVAWMAASFEGDREKIPSLKFLTGGSTLCDKQIANLSEVVQFMYDSWGGQTVADTYKFEDRIAAMNAVESDGEYVEVDQEEVTKPAKGCFYYIKNDNDEYVEGGVTDAGEWAEDTVVYTFKPTPRYAYATETTKPLAVLYVENMPKVVGEIYKQMFPEQWEDKDEIELNGSLPETPAADDTGDDDTTEYEYTEVNKAEVTTPVSGTTYYISDGEGGYTEGGTADDGEGGLIWDAKVDKVYTRSVKESTADDSGNNQDDDEPEYAYTAVDTDEVTTPDAETTYYVSDGEGGFTAGGTTTDGNETLIWDSQYDSVYTRDVNDYVLVDKSTEPVENETYYVKDANGGYTPGGLTEPGDWADVDVYTKNA